MRVALVFIAAALIAGCVAAGREVPPGGPMIALTFDDGPSEHTGRILDALERHGGRATFFVLGKNVEPWRDTIIRATAIGSEVAGHSWSHPRLPGLSPGEIAEELRSTSEAIAQVTGVAPRIYRPPFGELSRRVSDVSAGLGYAMVNWTFDPQDWRPENQDAELLHDAIMGAARHGAIVLMHDTIPAAADAMELIVPSLVAEGFQIVTVTELLYHLHGGIIPGRVYGLNWAMRRKAVWWAVAIALSLLVAFIQRQRRKPGCYRMEA